VPISLGRTSASRRCYRRIAEVAGAGVVIPRTVLNIVAADPDDNRILECAAEGAADIIVSNDHHLLDLKTHGSIPIVAGVDFRRILGMK